MVHIEAMSLKADKSVYPFVYICELIFRYQTIIKANIVDEFNMELWIKFINAHNSTEK